MKNLGRKAYADQHPHLSGIGHSWRSLCQRNSEPSNYAPDVNAPVYDVDGTTLLSGSSFRAQLYTGSTTNNLTACGDPVAFRTGSGAGYFFAGSCTTTVAGGQTGWAQIRVWDTSTGATNWASASVRGESGFLTITTASSSTSPPQIPSNLVGLQSFSLYNLGDFLMGRSEESSPVERPGAEFLSGFQYSQGELWLEITDNENGVAGLVLHNTSTTCAYQLLHKVDLRFPLWTYDEVVNGTGGTTEFSDVPIPTGRRATFFEALRVPLQSGVVPLLTITASDPQNAAILEHVTFAPIELPAL